MGRWLDDLVDDLRHASRLLRRQTGLAAITIVMLSLGIGANTAIFTLLNAALLRPLPFPDAERLVLLLDGRRGERTANTPTIPEVLDVRARTTTLDLVSFFDTRDAQVTGGTEPLRVVTARVEPALLPLTGARPALGRLFNDSDGREGSPPVVILSAGLWRRDFGADVTSVGRTVMVNGVATTIVGVLPPEFSIDVLTSDAIEMFVPYPMTADYTSRAAEFAGVRRVFAIGRLRPDASLERASADLGSIAAALEQTYPELYRSPGGGSPARPFVMDVQPLHEAMTEASRSIVWMLFGAVLLVLVIACVNTAQFLMATSLDRAPEVALRRALGAWRGRLVRQFLTEAGLLAIVAGALALVQALWLTAALRSILPSNARPLAIDRVVLAFTLVVAVATAAICGLFPALRFSRNPPQANAGARGSASRRGRSHQLLIALEVAISLVLLVQAGWLLRSLDVIQRSKSGFSSDNVAVMRVRGMAGGGPALGRLYARYLDQLATVSSVDAAAVSSSPLPGWAGTPFLAVDGPAAGRRESGGYQIVSPGYFAVLRIPLLAGRTFSADDLADNPPVAIVNQSLARLCWPDGQAIGQRIHGGVGPREATMTVIGVVGDVQAPLRPGDVPQIYVSYLQQSEPNMAVMVRGRETLPPIDAIKRAIWSVEARQAVFDVRPLDELVTQPAQRDRVLTELVGSFAILALVISVAGVFTVVTYAIARRIREIAVRRAVGADNIDIVWLLSGQTLRWSIVGLVAGTAAAVAASRVLRASLSELVPLDASIVLTVAAAYVIVVILAMSSPVRRALRVNPATALRAE